jgi:hypothetical protein
MFINLRERGHHKLPGKLKLISTGFGEAAIAVNCAKNYIDPSSKFFPGHSSDFVPKKFKSG